MVLLAFIVKDDVVVVVYVMSYLCTAFFKGMKMKVLLLVILLVQSMAYIMTLNNDNIYLRLE